VVKVLVSVPLVIVVVSMVGAVSPMITVLFLKVVNLNLVIVRLLQPLLLTQLLPLQKLQLPPPNLPMKVDVVKA
jgi:hypothetical protein